MKKPTYTIQMRPAESGQGYTATIVELGETITGSTQAEVWAEAHQRVFAVQEAALEAAEARRHTRQHQQVQKKTVA